MTIAVVTWFMVGTFLDAWAHANLATLETPFTPWHGVLYSGYLATAVWVGWQVRRAGAVPVGYGWGLVGLAIFAVGGIGDMLWHTVFGVERGVEAAVSPTHQILLVGMLLFLSIPFRAAWLAVPADRRPSYRAFLPALLSLTFVSTNTALVVVFLTAFFTGAPAGGFGEGIASILITTVLMVSPVLLVARRWRPPPGTVTTLYTVMGTLLGAVDRRPWLLVGLLLAGAAIDVLLGLTRSLRVIGTVTPALLWVPWFVATAATEGVTWSPELWSETIVWTSMLGLALSLLTVPPRRLDA